MLGAADDMILQRLVKKIELLAEPGYTDSQILILIGMFLRVDQRLRVNGVELDIAKSLLGCGEKNIYEQVDIAVGKQLGIHFHNGGGGAGRLFSRQFGHRV